MKCIAITGTQQGMSKSQLISVPHILKWFWVPGITLHHGDCVGADAEAHMFARMLGYRIVIHPCTIFQKRAWCSGADEILEPKPPLERNRHIVDACKVLIAVPYGASEVLRSGTWATIRYAKRTGKQVIIVWPNGYTICQ